VRACLRDGPVSRFGLIRACLIDSDGDGKFDQFSQNQFSKPGKLEHSVTYKRTTEKKLSEARSFRQLITYQGVNGKSLLLSYREFAADLARPAFTQELSIPLSDGYPQNVRFKGVGMKIDGIDGSGLRYSITEVPLVPPGSAQAPAE
jgi:hypothetical protein